MVTLTPLNCDKRGQELSLYYNVGDDGTQIWVEHVGLVGDMTLTETEELNEQSARSQARVVKEYNEGEIEMSVSGTQFTDPEYEGYILLRGMRRDASPQDILVLTGYIDELGSEGWRGMMRNSDRSVQGPESGNMTTNFNLQPSACTLVPVRFVKIVVSGTPADYDPASFSTVTTIGT